MCRSPVGWFGLNARVIMHGRTVARGGDVVVAVDTREAHCGVRAGVAAVRARCPAYSQSACNIRSINVEPAEAEVRVIKTSSNTKHTAGVLHGMFRWAALRVNLEGFLR